jgi:DNA polymerase III epsilon subunit-like protein
LAAVVLDKSGVEIKDASQFVKPRNPIPPFITKLTSITNNDVATAESFPAVGVVFIQFMQATSSYDLCNNTQRDMRTTMRVHQLITLFLFDTTERYSIYLFLFIN